MLSRIYSPSKNEEGFTLGESLIAGSKVTLLMALGLLLGRQLARRR